MIKINLLGEKKAASERKSKRARVPSADLGAQRQNLLFAAIVGMALVLAGGWWYLKVAETNEWKEKIEAHDRELERLAPIIAKSEQYERRKELLEQKINLITELKRRQDLPVHILDQISKNLPEFLWLSSMSANNNQINLAGRATTYNAVSNFYKNLTSSGYFDNVTLGRTFEEQAGVTFSLSASFTRAAAEPPAAENQG